MSWARFDDLYDDNRKVKRAFRREPMAVAVHVMAITYSARHETDGVVDLDWLEERIHDDEQRARVLAVLVDAGLFERLPAGESLTLHVEDRTKHAGAHDVTLGPLSEHAYVIHDYLDFNPSSVEARAKRQADAGRKRQARGSSAERPSGHHADVTRTPNGVPAASKAPDPTRPDPTHCPPPPPKGDRRRDREQWEIEALSWTASVGVQGDRAILLRALRQNCPWVASNGGGAGGFRAFVGQHFPALSVGDAP